MEQVQILKIDLIKPSKTNPRKTFDETLLKELAESIKEKGVINPIVVRQRGDDFEIVCGERRFRASKIAKVSAIPALVRDLTDEQVLELQVIENLQRDDLNVIDEAEGFKTLMGQCKYTQDELGKRIGKSQAYIAIRLALVDFRSDYVDMVRSGRLTPGHMKFIMTYNGCDKILDAVKKKLDEYKDGISVREFEHTVYQTISTQSKPLGKSQYSASPLFDTEQCADCQFNRKIKLWNGMSRRCVSPECYNAKQSAARKEDRAEVAESIKSGKMVKESQLPKEYGKLDKECCQFDTKECVTCEHCTTAKVKTFMDKTETKKICINKECFDQKQKDALSAKEKAEKEKYLADIERVKSKTSKQKIDRALIARALAVVIEVRAYSASVEALADAFVINSKTLQKPAGAIAKYFTGNKSLNIEHMLAFMLAWEDSE